MPPLGKVDEQFFEDVIYPPLDVDGDDVVVGPQHGVDFGVLDVGGRAVVLATDPISILPDLGFERAGRLALDVVLADVAVSGIPPTHVTVSLSLPREMTDDELASAWRGFAGRAADLDVGVVAGHTARYDGVDYSWVGGATGIGIGDRDQLVMPDGAEAGDAIIVTTGPGAEVAGLFSTLFPDELGLDERDLADARARLDDVAVVEDAVTAAAAGDVTAMHDATEGGLAGALVEMARGSGVRFDVEGHRVPVAPGVEAVFDAIDIDPWHSTSSGTLVITVDPREADDVVDALRARGTRAAVVGSVASGSGVFLDGERIAKPNVDPSWAEFARLADESR